MPDLFLLLLLLEAPVGPQLHVDVGLKTSQSPAVARVATLHAEPLAQSSPASSRLASESISASIPVPGSADLELRPKTRYTVRLEGDGVWAPPLTVSSGSPPSHRAVVASGAGRIRAQVANGTGQSLEEWPSQLQARFQLVESPLEISASETFETSCPVTVEEAARWLTCKLPEGVLDLRLEAEGFIPDYRWSQRIPPGGSIETQPMVLEVGASIIGNLSREGGEEAIGAEVVLEPSVGGSVGRARLGARMDTLAFRARSDKRGFFQLRGVPPGSYELEIRLSDYGVLRAPGVLVSEPVEQSLAGPLVIPFFPAATVAIDPPAAGDGKAWTVRLFQPGESPREVTADNLGDARFELLPEGEYLVMLDGGGDLRTARPAAFSPESPRVQIELALVPLVGTITLAGEPLAASLYFGGKHGAESVTVESGNEGEFVGILPREGTWSLEVRSDDPNVRWVTRALSVELDPGIGAAELSIDLPRTMLAGEVMDFDGTPAAGAQVIIQAMFREGGTTQVETTETGSFSVEGQSLGKYRVKAIGQELRASDHRIVELTEAQPEASLELVLKEGRSLRGRVVSGDGRGIAGATIRGLQGTWSEGSGAILIPSTTTDVEGTFTLQVPNDGLWEGVAVLAPGFLLAVVPFPSVSEDYKWEIALVQGGGGTLILSGMSGEQGSRVFPSASLDARWVLPSGLLVTWAHYQGTLPTAGSLLVPNLPPGSYAVCLARGDSGDGCQSGYLSAGSQLTLDLKENEE